MSFEEKRAWIYAVIATVVPLFYVVMILQQLPVADVGQLSYVRPMLIATAVAIGVNMIGNMFIGNPKEADRKDERDTGIYRYGTHAGYYVLAVGAAGALLLALGGFAHFWIANVLYLAFVFDALTSSIVKLVAYRRGF